MAAELVVGHMMNGAGDTTEEHVHIDVKYAEKPGQFSGLETEWLDWKFSFGNWCSLVDSRFDDLLDAAEAKKDPITVQTGDFGRPGRILYALLANNQSGKMLRLVKAVPSKNGWEAWRQLVMELEPKVSQRRLGMLGELINPSLSAAGDQE